MAYTTMKINYDLSARKWAITENILKVALIRRVSPQLVRTEIIQEAAISPALLSLLEKTPVGDKKNTLTIKVEDRLNTYFDRFLEQKIALNGNTILEGLQAA